MPFILFLLLTVPKIVAADIDRAKAEIKYAALHQKQVYSDLLALYDPANEAKLQITYAAFIPENRRRGGFDRGYGFHVVKRLVVADGTIEVNEAWPEDRETGGLLPPDEIRVKAHGVFQNIHLVWNIGNVETAIFMRTRYAGLDDKQRNTQYSMRVPVSAPYSCVGCHAPDSDLYRRFSAPGEKRNFAAIVQDSHFKLPLAQTIGFREYVDYLKNERKVSADFLSRVEKKLVTGRVAMRVPHLTEALRAGMTSVSWVGQDDDCVERHPEYLQRQGAYLDKFGRVCIDAMEMISESVFEGKYRYWTPTPLIP